VKRRFGLSFVLAVGVLTALPSVGVAASTLFGESFTATHFTTGATNCFTPGTGRVIYNVDGIAAGPLTGSFVERGDLNMTAGLVTRWDVTFTIFDQLGNQVATGTKALAGAATGTCSNTTVELDGSGTGALSYNATFADGTTETGPSAATFSFVNPSDLLTGTFSEDFGPSTPTGPKNKDDCKNAGYRNFPMFRNQGECIKFVNHMP
jgi:hypothetical protein